MVIQEETISDTGTLNIVFYAVRDANSSQNVYFTENIFYNKTKLSDKIHTLSIII